MSADPMRLVKFVCGAKAHAQGRSDSALTIYEGAWAFCATGADGTDHDWQPSDGLPLADAMRFTPRMRSGDPARSSPARPAGRGATNAPTERPRTR
jgi:hypothetical protein